MTLIDPSTTFIDDGVTIGRGTIIHPGVTLEGRTRIGAGCRIRSWVRITDSAVGDNVLINDSCIIVESQVDDEARVGPFSHLRPGSHMKAGSHVGNFVELKKTVLGEGSKASHLTYLGDADHRRRREHRRRHHHLQLRRREEAPDRHRGRRLHRQRLAAHRAGDGRRGAYMAAAGITVTDDVPPGRWRSPGRPQVNIIDWAKKTAENQADRTRRAATETSVEAYPSIPSNCE